MAALAICSLVTSISGSEVSILTVWDCVVVSLGVGYMHNRQLPIEELELIYS